jgi:hypothetical protein
LGEAGEEEEDSSPDGREGGKEGGREGERSDDLPSPLFPSMPFNMDRSSSGVEGPAAAAAAEAAAEEADADRSESVGRGERGREGGGARGASPLVGTIFRVSPSATPAVRRSSVEESCLPLKRMACWVGLSPLFPSIWA